ncbi:piezo-type mechanosensitive ion channel component 1 isoform X1 [Tachysurus ichikawai]
MSFQETQTDEEDEEEEDEEEGGGEEEGDRKEEKRRGPAQLCARLRATAQRFLHNMGRVLAVTLLGLAGERQHT